MDYLKFHNVNADRCALRLYGKRYQRLGHLAQMNVDDVVADEFMSNMLGLNAK